MMKNKFFMVFLFFVITFSGLSFNYSYSNFNAASNKLKEINIEQYEIEKLNVNEQTKPASNTKTQKTASTANSNSVINIVYDDGFKVKDSSLALTYEKSLYSIFIQGQHIVDIDTSNSSALIDGKMIVEIKEEDENVANEICVVNDVENNLVIVGKKKISDKASVNIYLPTDENNKDKDKDSAKAILDSAKEEKKLPTLNISDVKTSDWSNSIIVTDSSVSFKNGEDIVYVYKMDVDYEGTGFKKETVGETEILKSDISDSETGYSPYLLVTEDITYELLSPQFEYIEKIFSE